MMYHCESNIIMDSDITYGDEILRQTLEIKQMT